MLGLMQNLTKSLDHEIQVRVIRTFNFFSLDAFIVAKGISIKKEWQTGQILMGQLIISHLIWIYTICNGICFSLQG